MNKTVAEFRTVYGLCIFSQTDTKSKTAQVEVHDDLTTILEKVGIQDSGVLLPY